LYKNKIFLSKWRAIKKHLVKGDYSEKIIVDMPLADFNYFLNRFKKLFVRDGTIRLLNSYNQNKSAEKSFVDRTGNPLQITHRSVNKKKNSNIAVIDLAFKILLDKNLFTELEKQ
jgi:hypothetical protein